MIDIGSFLWSLIPPEVQPRFIGDLPSITTEGTTCLIYSSNASTQFFGMKNALYRPVAKFVSRVRRYPDGEEIMTKISDSLKKYTGDDEIAGINQIGSPIYLGRNTEKLHEFQVTFEIIVRE